MTEQRPVDPDDLSVWDDDDLVRALRSPGTTTELADEERYVAAFRDAGRSNVRSLPRRAAGRLGAGGTAVVVTVALTSGVAAAYTGHLPDPVQQLAHSVIGAPAPDLDGRHHSDASGPQHRSGVLPPAAPSSSSSASSSGGRSSSTSPAGGAPASPTSGTPGRQGVAPTGSRTGPTDAPSSGPTSTPTASSGGSASAMTMSAPTHRVGVGQTLAVTGLVTDATGAALADHPVVLQVRGPRHWRRVADATTDATGVASAVTPAITRSARFRWHADPGISSTPWPVRMVPTLSVSADVAGATTTISPSAQGTRAGDSFLLFRHVAGRTTLVRRARLDASGYARVSVTTPRHRATYAVRLFATKRHTAARARVLVVSPSPANLTVTGSRHVVAGGTASVGGTVTSAAGAALPGHRVVLLRRGPDRWRPVGRATTDSHGHVSIATPAINVTSRFRFRTDHRVHSMVWRVVAVPTLSASAERSTGTVTVTATAHGAHAGDRVVLLHRVDGRLVRVRHGRLGAGGSVTLSVKARHDRTTYVVRLLATTRHGPAKTAVTLPGA